MTQELFLCVVSDVLTSDSGLEEERMSSGGGGERTSTSQQPGEVFIRSFVFHPDLPIRVDYEGKRFDTMAVVGTGVYMSPSVWKECLFLSKQKVAKVTGCLRPCGSFLSC